VVIIIALSALGVAALLWYPLFPLIPVFERNDCVASYIHELQEDVDCLVPHAQALVFVILNWFELVGFFWAYWILRNLKEMVNIRKEMFITMCAYVISSLIYFFISTYGTTNSLNHGEKKFLDLLAVTAILMRNITATLSSTCFSIWAFKYNSHA
jgi:hypothetical protein